MIFEVYIIITDAKLLFFIYILTPKTYFYCNSKSISVSSL